MAKRLERRLDGIRKKRPEDLDIILNCFCSTHEAVPHSEAVLIADVIGPKGERVRTFDLCPVRSHRRALERR